MDERHQGRRLRRGLPPVPAEATFSDIWKNFDFGLAGRFEGRKNRLGFGLDFTYNNLGAPVASSAPVVGSLGLNADVRQLFTEGFAFYRVAHGGRADNPAHLDVLVACATPGPGPGSPRTRARASSTTGSPRTSTGSTPWPGR